MGERGWSALLRLAPLEQLAPATRGDLDVELAGRGAYPLPGTIPVGVAHTLDLVEACDRVADVLRVDEGFFALLREREGAVRQVVHLGGGQPTRPWRRAPTRTGGLRTAGLLQVLPRRLLLLGGRHR